jgi:hypothetical protein
LASKAGHRNGLVLVLVVVLVLDNLLAFFVEMNPSASPASIALGSLARQRLTHFFEDEDDDEDE